MRESEGQETLDHECEIPEGAIQGLNDMIKDGGSPDVVERGEIDARGRGVFMVTSPPIINRVFLLERLAFES
jgi:hypothetical protein